MGFVRMSILFITLLFMDILFWAEFTQGRYNMIYAQHVFFDLLQFVYICIKLILRIPKCLF